MNGTYLYIQKQDINNFSTLQVMEQLIAATMVIGDRSYRIKCARDDEEVVRKTVKTINDKIIEFKTQFAGKDMQDYVAMVLLWFATDQITQMKAGLKEKNFSGELEIIEQILDNQLKDK
jgi:cell division protein ZapA (FtsZ GTPase activity inhibitor)